MERAEVVVRQSGRSTEPARVGAVLSVDGTRCRVRWEDSGEEEDVVVAGSTRRARRGSLRHQALVDPSPIACWFADDPKGMILRLLREQAWTMSPMSPLRIRQELQQLGLDPAAVKKAWTAASKTLGNNDDVEVTGKKRMLLYRWIGRDNGAAVTAAAPAPAPERVPDATPGPQPPASGTPVPLAAPVVETGAVEGGAGADEPAVAVVADQLRDESGATAAPVFERESPLGDADPDKLTRPEEQLSVADRISEAIGDEPPADLQDYLSRPLRVGVRFGQLESQRLDAFLGSLQEEDRALAENLLLALPRQSAAIDGTRRRTPLDGSIVAQVLAAAAEEIRTYAEPKPAVLAAASWLLRRAATVADLPTAAAAPLIVLLIRVGVARRDQDVPILDSAAGALGRLLPILPRDERAGLDLSGLAQAVAHLPLRRDGGRAALLAAIGKFRSKTLLLPEWWEGATVDALADCATGVLGGVTSRPEIIEQYIDPLVARELSQVTSRTRLGFLLGLPGEFVEHLPAEAVAAAFRRIAGGDQVVAGWVGALAQEQRVEALRRDVDRAQADAANAEQRAEAAEQRMAALADRCERLEETLRDDHAQASSLRSAQDRQIRIDVIRSLADLAAEVEELAVEQTGPDVLVERVRALVSAQALEPIGQAGQKLTFDLTAHEPIVGSPGNGTAVTVIRPGYRWRPGSEDILIEKALVTTT